MRTLTLLLVAALTCTACSGAPEDGGVDNGTDQALTNGQATTEHPEVGRVELTASLAGNTNKTNCTGTLVAPTVVLTTRHCAFGALAASGGTFFIDKGNQAHRFAIKYGDGLTHSGTANASRRGSYYLAKLASPVPASVATPVVLRKATINDNERLVAFGYGQASDGWGKKSSAAFTYHYDGWTGAGPSIMQSADTGCAAFDARGQLAAMGTDPFSASAFFSHPDAYVEMSEYYDQLVELIATFSAS
jgi:hypothetical protein